MPPSGLSGGRTAQSASLPGFKIWASLLAAVRDALPRRPLHVLRLAFLFVPRFVFSAYGGHWFYLNPRTH